MHRGGVLLTGTVADVSGGPIASALVEVEHVADTQRGAFALTDANGNYQLRAPAGELRATASHAEYDAQQQPFMLSVPARLDFRLVPGATITGVVVRDSDGAPVAQAEVRATRGSTFARSLVRAVHTAADGSFTLRGLPPGSVKLDAHDATRTLRVRAPVTVGVGIGEARTGIELRLGVTPMLRGRVRDASGKAEAGAQIVALCGTISDRQQTDASGAFALAARAGTCQLLATASDGRQASTSALVDEHSTPVEVVLPRQAIVVRGRVVPAGLAQVFVVNDTPGFHPETPAPVKTTAAGEFEIKPVVEGRIRVRATTASGQYGETRVEVGPDGLSNVVVSLQAGASISGRVLERQGQPVSNFTVMALAVSGPIEHVIKDGRIASGTQVLTDAEGRFLMVGLAPGSYELSVLDRGGPVAEPEAALRLELQPGERKEGVELKIARPRGVLQGVVVDRAGQPLVDAYVSLAIAADRMLDAGARAKGASTSLTIMDTGAQRGQTMLTDAAGRFRFDNLTPGPYRLVAEADAGKARGTATAVTGGADIRMTVHPLGEIRGRITANGKAVTQFSVSLEQEPPVTMEVAHSHGEFHFYGVEPGSYRVSACTANGTGSALATVTAGTVTTTDLAIASDGFIVGRLVDKNGNGRAKVPVFSVVDKPSGSTEQIMLDEMPPATDARGRFRISAPAGPRRLLFLGAPATTRSVNVTAGQVTDVGDVIDGDEP